MPRDTIGTITPRDRIGGITPRDRIGSITPRHTIGSITPRHTIESITPRHTIGSITPRDTIGSITPRDMIGSIMPRDTDDTTDTEVSKRKELKPSLSPMFPRYKGQSKFLSFWYFFFNFILSLLPLRVVGRCSEYSYVVKQ
jgi:hypothetical protein